MLTATGFLEGRERAQIYNIALGEKSVLLSIFSKVGSGKILEKSSPEKVYELTLSLTFHAHSIATNHLYNCQ